jgi:hypothetical protein
MKYKLTDRLSLQYMDQVEFIRFIGIIEKCENEIRHYKLDIENAERVKKDCLDELDRLMKKDKPNAKPKI